MMMSALRSWIATRPRGRVVSIALVALVVAVQVGTFLSYTLVTADVTDASLYLGLRGASRNHLLSQLEAAAREARPGAAFAVDSETPVMGKIASFYTRGTPLYYLALYPFANVIAGGEGLPLAQPLVDAFTAAVQKVVFQWRDGTPADPIEFAPSTLPPPGTRFDLLTTSQGYSVFNRAHAGAGAPGRQIQAMPDERIANHLIFTSSSLSQSYYLPKNRERVGFWGNEADYFQPGQSMAGVGRRLLFRVVNPTPRPHLLVELSATLAANGDNRLPPAVVVGADSRPVGLIGRGSARVYSDAITPQEALGQHFVGLDMTVDGSRFQTHRHGLMWLFGAGIELDPRRLVGFARDVSLVSDEDWRALKPPRQLSAFPRDLANKALEYSGLYEDGWMSETAFVRLAGSDEPAVLEIAGVMPKIDERSRPQTLTVLADGVEVGRRVPPFGHFAFRMLVPPSGPTRRIDLRFDHVEALPNGDRRPVTALLERIGWEPAVLPSHFEPGGGMLDDPLMRVDGVWSDGWTAGHGAVTLAGGGPARLHLTAMTPRIPGDDRPVTLTLRVDGAVLTTQPLTPGDLEVSPPVPAAAAQGRRIEWDVTPARPLPAPDTRAVGVLLRGLELIPEGPR